MREQELQLEPGRDPEATVIKPLFDEDATEVARPVVPLDDRAVTAGVGAYVETGTAPPVYTRAWKRRNQSMVMLVLAALFAGTVAGIAGVYLYQRSRTSDAAGKTAATQQQHQTPAASEAPPTATAPQPTTPSTAEAAPPTAPPLATVEPPADTEAEVAAGRVAESEKSTVKVSDGEGASRETARANARRAPEEEAPSVAPVKRGRKGGDDDEPDEPRITRPRVYDTQEPAPSGSAAERRAAREEQRLRRMRRERRRGRGEAYMVDSIRGIFEGGRQSPPR